MSSPIAASRCPRCRRRRAERRTVEDHLVQLGGGAERLEARDARIASDLSVPCRADLKNKKIMVVIGERQSNGYIAAQQQKAKEAK